MMVGVLPMYLYLRDKKKLIHWYGTYLIQQAGPETLGVTHYIIEKTHRDVMA